MLILSTHLLRLILARDKTTHCLASQEPSAARGCVSRRRGCGATGLVPHLCATFRLLSQVSMSPPPQFLVAGPARRLDRQAVYLAPYGARSVVFSNCWWYGVEGSAKLIAIHKEPNYRVMHEHGFGETNCFACQ